MRDALSLADQVLSMGDGQITTERVREALGLVPEDEFIAILDLIVDRRAADVFPAVARLADAGIDFGGLLTGLADMLRAQLTVVLGGVASDVSDRAREALVARRDRFAAADLLRMLQAIGELEPRFRKSGQQQLLVETLIVRFALLDRSIELEDVLRSLDDQPPRASAAPRRDSTSGSSGGPGGGGGSGNAAGGGNTSPFVRPEPRPVPRADGSGARAEVAIRPAPRPVLRTSEPFELSKVTGRWDELVERLRGGKPMLASALEHAAPVAVTAAGVLTIELDESNDIFAHAITTGRPEIAVALGEWFSGVDRIELRRDEDGAAAPPKRLTDEMVRAERIASLKKRDPILRAAIEALDLDVVD
jgi:DNA polymerase-3 subunit gamma/tau